MKRCAQIIVCFGMRRIYTFFFPYADPSFVVNRCTLERTLRAVLDRISLA